MKKFVKIGLVVGGVVAVGALACYGLKKLMEKTQCCGCCDGECECGGECDDTCKCECHDAEKIETAEPVTEPATENVATDADFEKTE